jgi:hypothetical protein
MTQATVDPAVTRRLAFIRYLFQHGLQQSEQPRWQSQMSGSATCSVARSSPLRRQTRT